MRVVVFVGKESHDIDIDPSAVFGQVKEQIYLISKVPVNVQRLVFKGKERANRERMDEAGVTEGSKMMILTKGRAASTTPAPGPSATPSGTAARSPGNTMSFSDLVSSQSSAASTQPVAQAGGGQYLGYSGSSEYQSGPEWTSRPNVTVQNAAGTRLGGTQATYTAPERRGVCYGPRQVLRAVGHGICAIPAAIRYVGSVLYLAMVHPRTGFGVRFLSGFTAFYALWPISFMPARIPGHGFLDVMLVLPLLIIIIIWYTPSEVIAECRQIAAYNSGSNRFSDRDIAFIIDHWRSSLVMFTLLVSVFFSLVHMFLQWVDPNGNILFIVYLVLMLYLLFRVMRQMNQAQQMQQYPYGYQPSERQPLNNNRYQAV